MNLQLVPNPSAAEKVKDGLFRLLSVATRRYSRHVSDRPVSAKNAVVAAIRLYAAETSPAEAALLTAEALAPLAEQERREGRR